MSKSNNIVAFLRVAILKTVVAHGGLRWGSSFLETAKDLLCENNLGGVASKLPCLSAGKRLKVTRARHTATLCLAQTFPSCSK